MEVLPFQTIDKNYKVNIVSLLMYLLVNKIFEMFQKQILQWNAKKP